MAAAKKNRKYGRNKDSAANAAYKGGNRCAVNKAKRAKREERKAEKRAAKTAKRVKTGKPMRGEARKKRREKLQRIAA